MQDNKQSQQKQPSASKPVLRSAAGLSALSKLLNQQELEPQEKQAMQKMAEQAVNKPQS